jgi:ferrochelatase
LGKTAVVLFNLGGPDSLDAVEPFLFNLFSDPDIFNLPFGQKLFARLIANRRAPKVMKEYDLIGGKSPISEWTEKQRDMLERNLRIDFPDTDVYTAMRYWRPFTSEVAAKVESVGYNKIILLPLYPQYSITTTGSSYNEWNRWFAGNGKKPVLIKDYHLNDKYIAALNERIDETILQFPAEVRNNIQLVFSAHGTPVSLVKKGDPYSLQIRETVEAVMTGRSFSHEHHLCFLSKVGPMKWLEPATDQMIEILALDGKINLLIIPISFVSDHVATLFDLEIEYRHTADKCGIQNYMVMKGLNDSRLFIEALADLVRNTFN